MECEVFLLEEEKWRGPLSPQSRRAKRPIPLKLIVTLPCQQSNLKTPFSLQILLRPVLHLSFVLSAWIGMSFQKEGGGGGVITKWMDVIFSDLKAIRILSLLEVDYFAILMGRLEEKRPGFSIQQPPRLIRFELEPWNSRQCFHLNFKTMSSLAKKTWAWASRLGWSCWRLEVRRISRIVWVSCYGVWRAATELTRVLGQFPSSTSWASSRSRDI